MQQEKRYEFKFLNPDEVKRKYQRINTIKQKLSDNYRNLRNSTSGIKTLLASEVPCTVFSHDTAVRVYLWDKNGIDIPNISETDRQKLIKTVLDNPQLIPPAPHLELRPIFALIVLPYHQF